MKYWLCLAAIFAVNVSYADAYLSRGICSLEFESIHKHSGSMTEKIAIYERKALLEKIQTKTGSDCLARKLADWNESKAKGDRAIPYVDKCPFLPRSYYADKHGRTLFVMNEKKFEAIELKLYDDESLARCYEPLLN